MSSENPTPERTEKGQYAAGNKGGPGNPFARQVAALRKALLDAVTPEDLAEVSKALLAKAKKGDVPAARVLLGYLIGKPAPTVDPDRLAVDERDRFREQATIIHDMVPLASSLDPEVPLGIIRFVRPGLTEKRGAIIRDALLNPEKYQPAPLPEDDDDDPEADAASDAELMERIKQMQEEARRSANGSTPPLPWDVSDVPVVDRPSANGGERGPRPSANGGNRHAERNGTAPAR